MARPTGRGFALLGVAATAYVAARVVGTWELYVLAAAFATLVLLAWLFVTLTARRLEGARAVAPARPTAGDQLSVTLTVANGSLLPGPQITAPDPAGGMGGGEDGFEIETLPPHGRRVVATPPQPARRGVHHVPELLVRAEDPLGLALARRGLGGPFDLTIYPRLVDLSTCALFPGMGTRRERGLRGLTTLGASEFRGVRPHNPGEPLSRIDWKATAKTGELMLREMDDPTSGDVTVLLDAPLPAVAGDPPDTNLELAVQVAGSVADFALRAGRRVALLLPQNEFRRNRLIPCTDGRVRLLESLARVAPHPSMRLGPSLRALLAERGRRPSRAVALVTLALDAELVQALIALRDEGLQVSVVQVDGASFAGGKGHAPEDQALALAAGGVRCLTVGRADDLRTVLSATTHDLWHHDPAERQVRRALVR